MKIGEVITTTDALYRNNFTIEQKIGWLAELDEKIFKEEYSTHQTLCDGVVTDWVKYIEEQSADVEVNEDTELLAQRQYQEMYVFYLLYKYFLYSGETDRAEIHLTLYQDKYQNFVNFINRTYLPLQKSKVSVPNE